MAAVFEYPVVVTTDDIDHYNHVNNVVYLRWMQEAAVAHCEDIGVVALTRAEGAGWFVRSHFIEYLSQVTLGDDLMVRTWASRHRGFRSTRKFALIRTTDDKLMARGETECLYVRLPDGRPKRIPQAILDLLPVIEDA
jgi:acyl-CoA thioester hydrolase